MGQSLDQRRQLHRHRQQALPGEAGHDHGYCGPLVPAVAGEWLSRVGSIVVPPGSLPGMPPVCVSQPASPACSSQARRSSSEGGGSTALQNSLVWHPSTSSSADTILGCRCSAKLLVDGVGSGPSIASCRQVHCTAPHPQCEQDLLGPPARGPCPGCAADTTGLTWRCPAVRNGTRGSCPPTLAFRRLANLHCRRRRFTAPTPTKAA